MRFVVDHVFVLPAACRMPAGEGCDLVAIAATGHRAPTPAARARVIIEKEAAGRVGADAKAGACAFGDQLSGGSRDSGEEPIQSPFAGDKLQAPFAVLLEEFVVPFGDAQYFVEGLDPITQKSFFVEQREEGPVQGSVQSVGFAEEGASALWIILGKCRSWALR